jgi:hypothetical protein
MRMLQPLSRLSLAGSAVLMFSAVSEAAETRFVASSGSDANPCTLAAPCRTLGVGVQNTPAGGELVVLDSANYGASLAITRSITISADGVTATLPDPGNIVINSAGAVVTLRGLHLKGAGVSGTSGIRIDNAAAVHIENCTIESFRSRGILLTADDAELAISDSIVRNNTLSGLEVSASNASVTIDNSRFENNGSNGVTFVGTTQSTITRSIASGNSVNGITQNAGNMNVTWTTAAHNGTNGFLALSGGELTLESSVSRGNGVGLRVSGSGSRARVSRSVFTDNDTGIEITSGATVQTLENNMLLGNATNLSNAGTVTAPGPF